MLGLQLVNRIRWEAVGVAVPVALAGIALAVPLAHPRVIAVGLVVGALLIAIFGGVLQRRPDVTELIRLKEEGTALLNRAPMTFLKRGEKKDLTQALTMFQIAVARWFEEALPILRQAGATDGEVSHFTTIITYTPAQPVADYNPPPFTPPSSSPGPRQSAGPTIPGNQDQVICPTCGNPVRANSLYCRSCGARLR